MTLIANIGARGLYLMFVWLLSAAGAAWLAERKGYGERVGLTFGLVLTILGFLIVLLLPGRPGSKWRVEGWRPKPSRAPEGRSARSAEPRPPAAEVKPPRAEPPPPAVEPPPPAAATPPPDQSQ